MVIQVMESKSASRSAVALTGPLKASYRPACIPCSAVGRLLTISTDVDTPRTSPSASWKSLSIPVTEPSAPTVRYGGWESPANTITPASWISWGKDACRFPAAAARRRGRGTAGRS